MIEERESNEPPGGGLVFGRTVVPVVVFVPPLGVTPVGQVVPVVLHAAVAGPLGAFIVGILGLGNPFPPVTRGGGRYPSSKKTP